MYVNGVTVLWDIFLSYIKHKPEDDSDTERENVIKNAAQLWWRFYGKVKGIHKNVTEELQ